MMKRRKIRKSRGRCKVKDCGRSFTRPIDWKADIYTEEDAKRDALEDGEPNEMPGYNEWEYCPKHRFLWDIGDGLVITGKDIDDGIKRIEKRK